MKKTQAMILTSLSLFLIIGCNGNNNSSSTNSISSMEENKTFVSKWSDEGVKQNIEESIKFDIPFIEAKSYYSYCSSDEFNEPVLNIGCNFETDEELDKAMDNYYSICDNAGYIMSRETIRQSTGLGSYYEIDCGFADYVINEDFAIEIQFVIGKVDKNASNDQLCIIAFTYVPVDNTKWPTNLFEHYLGFDIPHYEFEGAEYSASVEVENYNLENGENVNIPLVSVTISNASSTSENEYYQILTDLEYRIDDSSYDEGYGYYAFSKDKTHLIEFYYSTYYGLLIFAWPLDYLTL